MRLQQQEKARVQKDLNRKRAEYNDLNNKHIRVLSQNDVLVTDNAQQRQMINSLKREFGENDAEFDYDSDDPLLRRIRRECEKRVKDCEERLKQSQAEGQLQAQLLDKTKKDLAEARGEADDAHRGAISIFNEQKRYESHIQRLQSEVHRANSAVEKMRAEIVSLRIKNQDVRDERANLQRQFDSAETDNHRAVEERERSFLDLRSTILDLRSLLERRNRDLNDLEQSEANTQEERTRLQLHATEMSTTLVVIRQELEESRVAATAARVAEEASWHA